MTRGSPPSGIATDSEVVQGLAVVGGGGGGKQQRRFVTEAVAERDVPAGDVGEATNAAQQDRRQRHAPHPPPQPLFERVDHLVEGEQVPTAHVSVWAATGLHDSRVHAGDVSHVDHLHAAAHFRCHRPPHDRCPSLFGDAGGGADGRSHDPRRYVTTTGAPVACNRRATRSAYPLVFAYALRPNAVGVSGEMMPSGGGNSAL
jgi:hypothetical protein